MKQLRPIVLVILIGTAIVRMTIGAEPFIPKSDDEVLEVLPKSLISDELTNLRRQLTASPDDLPLASKVAGRYLAMGNVEGDPRFFGYARAALKPWWDQENPPPKVLRLRAKLREKEHRYDDAIVDIRKLLQQESQNAQAWIELANILRVQGKYEEAWTACNRLSEFGGEIPTAICKIPLQTLTGQAEEASQALTQLLPKLKQEFPSVVPWANTMQSKVANALGRIEEAEQLYRQGLSRNAQDKYLIRDYADFLLDQNRNDEALSLTRDHISDNGVLLRAAIAAKRVGETELAKRWSSQLERRFEEIRLRGGQPHGRFESRYQLEVNDQPEQALELALANWEQQKEVRDTRNVLESAIAANNRNAAKSVVAFLEKHGTQHVVLSDLLRKLESR